MSLLFIAAIYKHENKQRGDDINHGGRVDGRIEGPENHR